MASTTAERRDFSRSTDDLLQAPLAQLGSGGAESSRISAHPGPVKTGQNHPEPIKPWPKHGTFPECLPDRIRDNLVPCPLTGCWLWTGATNEKGYGVVWWRGKRRKLHRVVFELVHGHKPRRDRQLLHKCDTRPCCHMGEGAHLREGTASENMTDCKNKGRLRGCCGRVAA